MRVFLLVFLPAAFAGACLPRLAVDAVVVLDASDALEDWLAVPPIIF